MPRRAAPLSFEERVSESWLDEAGKVAARVAADEGPPPDANKVSDAEAVRQWGIRDPFVDDSTRSLLTSSGLPPEAVQQTIFWKELSPELQQEWLEWLAQPIQDETFADEVVAVLEHPLRWNLVMDYSDDEDERERYAARIQRGWEKTWPDLDAPLTMGGRQDGGNDAQQPQERPRPEDQASAVRMAGPAPTLALPDGGVPQGVGQQAGAPVADRGGLAPVGGAV